MKEHSFSTKKEGRRKEEGRKEGKSKKKVAYNEWKEQVNMKADLKVKVFFPIASGRGGHWGFCSLSSNESSHKGSFAFYSLKIFNLHMKNAIPIHF